MYQRQHQTSRSVIGRSSGHVTSRQLAPEPTESPGIAQFLQQFAYKHQTVATPTDPTTYDADSIFAEIAGSVTSRLVYSCDQSGRCSKGSGGSKENRFGGYPGSSVGASKMCGRISNKQSVSLPRLPLHQSQESQESDLDDDLLRSLDLSQMAPLSPATSARDSHWTVNPQAPPTASGPTIRPQDQVACLLADFEKSMERNSKEPIGSFLQKIVKGSSDSTQIDSEAETTNHEVSDAPSGMDLELEEVEGIPSAPECLASFAHLLVPPKSSHATNAPDPHRQKSLVDQLPHPSTFRRRRKPRPTNLPPLFPPAGAYATTSGIAQTHCQNLKRKMSLFGWQNCIKAPSESSEKQLRLSESAPSIQSQRRRNISPNPLPATTKTPPPAVRSLAESYLNIDASSVVIGRCQDFQVNPNYAHFFNADPQTDSVRLKNPGCQPTPLSRTGPSGNYTAEEWEDEHWEDMESTDGPEAVMDESGYYDEQERQSTYQEQDPETPRPRSMADCTRSPTRSIVSPFDEAWQENGFAWSQESMPEYQRRPPETSAPVPPPPAYPPEPSAAEKDHLVPQLLAAPPVKLLREKEPISRAVCRPSETPTPSSRKKLSFQPPFRRNQSFNLNLRLKHELQGGRQRGSLVENILARAECVPKPPASVWGCDFQTNKY